MLGTAKFSGAATTNAGAGTHILSVSLDGNTLTKNYNVVLGTGSVVISKKAITVYAVAKDRVYDGSAGGSFSYRVEGLVSGDSESILGTAIYTGTATTASAVGSYELNVIFEKAAGLANYTVSYVSDDFEIYSAGN